MKVLTCNVRCIVANDGPNHWAHRKHLCIETIRRQQPDLIGFQELWEPQQRDLAAALPEFAVFGTADEPTGRNAMNAIFYRRDRFALLSAGAYWLSETPHVPGSRSWDSAYIRLANWVRLEDREEGGEFRFINTHLDNVSQAARENQARRIVEDAAGFPEDYPQLLSGDMNADARNPALDVFRNGGWQDTYGLVHGSDDPGFTYHAFQGPRYDSSEGKIDWILKRGTVEAQDAEVIRDADGDLYPSDHYFVAAILRMRRD